MAAKTVSTRMSIIGRGANCRGGKSAVEKSAYISRTTQYSEYYAETYYPKYTEDLVHTDILLPDNAPERYLDRSVLWNSVEAVEKHSKAQLARLYKVSLPNAWPRDMAVFF
ncbi:MAG: MobA/MobL family protein, partial [Lachnospiraceae bacterium]|nr:MobA/MobL family protein [Lachnospiraceae bacterium]